MLFLVLSLPILAAAYRSPIFTSTASRVAPNYMVKASEITVEADPNFEAHLGDMLKKGTYPFNLPYVSSSHVFIHYYM